MLKAFADYKSEPFPKQAQVFTCLQCKSFENTVGKGEIACYEQFLLFSQYFLTFWITFSHVYQISNCHLQILSVRKSQKFAVWERVNIWTRVKFCQEIYENFHEIL